MDPRELRFGRFRLDPVRRVLLADGQPSRLGARAIDLLVALVLRRERVVGKDELFDLVWPELVVEENNLQQHVSALRKLLGAQAIATVPGRGYQFILPLDDDPPTAASPAALPTAAPDAPSGNLPARPTPLIGREHDLAELLARLASHPLVTLVGPGGIGKTCLALAAAQAVRGSLADGAWAVDLAPLGEGASVAAAVAREMAIQPAPGADEAATVAAALRRQSMLLLLDNCEHVLDAAAALVDALRQRAPGVHVLATSQAPLKLAGEQVIRLGPLALPPLGDHPTEVGAAPAQGAVQLFITRARAVDRHFEATPDNLAAVVEVCRRLDGLPLAIELAAARVPLLGVQGLARRLNDALQLLAARQPRLPPRQQTLRAALAWSHGLLGADEQAVFRRLAVFAGGFSVELVQRVLADDQLAPWQVLDHLGTLVDRSLVIAEGGGEPRYRLLEPARLYALELLGSAGELGLLRNRHAQAMGDLLLAFDQAVQHQPGFEALVRHMAAELDNLGAALQWVGALAQGEAVPGAADGGCDPATARLRAIHLAAHSEWLWGEVGRAAEGLAACRRALVWLDDDVPLPLALRLRLAHQGLARAQRAPVAAWVGDARQAVAGYRVLADRFGLYRALCLLGGAPRSAVSEAEAGAMLHEAAQLEDPRWSPRVRMRLQVSLEWWHDLGGRLEQSREAGLRHLALGRATGSVHEVRAMGNLADTEFALGHVDEAIALCRAAIARAAALSRPTAATHAYENMVPALLERGELDEAEAAIRAGRALRVRSEGHAYTLLMPLALLVQRRGDGRLALQLIGCADHAYAAAGMDPDPPERRMREAVLGQLAPALSATALRALLDDGARWGEDEGFARAGLA